MSDIEQTIERIAKNVGCDAATIASRMEEVLGEQQATWIAAGKTEEQCTLLALRVAGRLVKNENDKLKRSGCVTYEGMFLTSPKYKDWAEYAYKQMKNQLETLSDDAVKGLVEAGKMVLFEYDPVGGGYTKYSNPSLNRKEAFSEGITEATVDELPKEAVIVNSDRAFYLIWNNNTPSFQNGKSNFKYGSARPQSEKERTCLFFGRQQGTKDWGTLTMRYSGALALIDHPTYVPGNIAMYPGRDGTVAYGKPNLSNFIQNDDLSASFPADPAGIVEKEATAFLENGFADLGSYITTHKGDKDWYDQWVAFKGEVAHIDPRENGGFVMTVGDLDVNSFESTDVYVPQTQEDLLTFTVGSEILLVGQPWMNKDGEVNFSTTGWWCSDAMVAPAPVEGWD